MDIMLASFGLAEELYWKSKGKELPENKKEYIFYKAPPFFYFHPELVVDVTPFILYDKVIVDKIWVETGIMGRHDFLPWCPIFDKENLANLLHHNVIVERDYTADSLSQLYLLEKITDHDLSMLDVWRQALNESSGKWTEYAKSMESNIGDLINKQPIISNQMDAIYMLYPHVLQSEPFGWRRQKQLDFSKEIDDLPIDNFRSLLQGFLLNTNNSLLLSRNYSVGLLDWFDYEPFYKTKLMLGKVGQPSAIPTVLQGETILSFYLPIERITSVHELLQVRDKAKGLREYIDAKQHGESGADERTLLKILLEIERAQRKTEYYQKIASYITLPLSLIPLGGPFAEKIVRDIVHWRIEKKFLGDYRWHFSLLDYSSIQFEKSILVEQTSQVLPMKSLQENDEVFQQCASLTKEGRRCKNRAILGSNYCLIHKAQQ